MTPLSPEFIKSLGSLPGIDAAALAASLDTPPSVSIRLNNRKTLPEDLFPQIDKESVEWCGDGAYLSERPVFTLDPAMHGGAYYVQDASSMIYQQIARRLAERLCREEGEAASSTDISGRRPLTVLDFCAAPGGKSTAMLNGLPDGTVLVSNEFVAARGKILRENLEKWGYPGVITTGSPSSQYAGLPEIFDIVAVDAPCSGEGMMRKDEEARRQWSEALVDQCASLQREILSDLVSTIRPGGYLIYSTCTFNIHEDEENSRFIAEELGLTPVSLESLGLTGIGKAAPALHEGVEGLRFMPHLTRGEGLYVSVFYKPSADSGEEVEDNMNYLYPESGKAKKSKGKKGASKNDSSAVELTAAIRNELKGWIGPEIDPQFELSGSMITMLPSPAIPVLDRLRSHGVNVTGAGLPIAEIKGRGPKAEIIPDSRLALNLALRKTAFPSVELDKEMALSYLRGESASLGENIPRGYVVVTYKGLPLGMMKNLGNRANNLFPKAWRIRMSQPH